MKWGIMATGVIARKFAKTIIAMKDSGEAQSLVACASRSAEKAEAFAREYGATNAYSSYEDMLKDSEVEAVYVATPNSFHYENCLACLNAGKHVLCEKPFTVHKWEAEKLYALAKEKGLFIMEAFWIRFLPALIKMQEIIKSGEIGEVVYARSDYGFISSGQRKIDKLSSALGAGALHDIGVYNLGFMRMVMCDESIIGYKAEYRKCEHGADDFSTIFLNYPNGKSATITTCIGMDMPRNAAIYGTKGSIYFDDFQRAERMKVCVQGKEPYTLEYPILMGGFEYEIREVDRCVSQGLSESPVLKNIDTLEIVDFSEKVLTEWDCI